jgi:hypothetical protein
MLWSLGHATQVATHLAMVVNRGYWLVGVVMLDAFLGTYSGHLAPVFRELLS